MNKTLLTVLFGLLLVVVLVKAQSYGEDDEGTDESGSDLNELRDVRQYDDDEDAAEADVNEYRDARASIRLTCRHGLKPVRVRGGRYVCIRSGSG